jgi:hypothetical protein
MHFIKLIVITISFITSILCFTPFSYGAPQGQIPQVRVECRWISIPLQTFEKHFKDKPKETFPLSEVILEKIQGGAFLHQTSAVSLSGESAKTMDSKEYTYIDRYEGTPTPLPVKVTRELGSILDFKGIVDSKSEFINLSISLENVELTTPMRQFLVPLPGSQSVNVDQPEFLRRMVTTNLLFADGATMIVGIFDPLPSELKRGVKETDKILALCSVQIVDPHGKPIKK